MNESRADDARRAVFRLVYVLPTALLLMVRVLRRAPTVGAPGVVLGAVFGSFLTCFLAGTLVLPGILRLRGREDLASGWRMSALRGLDCVPLWLFFWSAIYVHAWPLQWQLSMAAVACALSYVLLWYMDRRWHIGIFGGRDRERP